MAKSSLVSPTETRNESDLLLTIQGSSLKIPEKGPDFYILKTSPLKDQSIWYGDFSNF